jgi:ElaB/YqjD/DUF883 family membrane-anchored ribosome-binding protein
MVDENEIKGVIREGVGHVQDAFGGATGDLETQAKGKVNEAAGGVQKQAGRVAGQAREIVDEVGELIVQRPYAAVGVAAIVGLVIGLLL